MGKDELTLNLDVSELSDEEIQKRIEFFVPKGAGGFQAANVLKVLADRKGAAEAKAAAAKDTVTWTRGGDTVSWTRG